MVNPLQRKLMAQLLIALLVGIFLLGGVLFGYHSELTNSILIGIEKLQNQSYGVRLGLCIIALSIIALCGILPASTGAFVAGVCYGIFNGFLVATLATLIGAFISFFLSRSLFRNAIERLLSRSARLQRFDHLMHHEGWKLVCLLRISPIMPFALTSYALGMTSISVRSYFINTLASLPALLGYVMMGHMTGMEAVSLHTHNASILKTLLLMLAFLGTALLVWHLGTFIQKLSKIPPASLMNDKKNT